MGKMETTESHRDISIKLYIGFAAVTCETYEKHLLLFDIHRGRAQWSPFYAHICILATFIIVLQFFFLLTGLVRDSNAVQLTTKSTKLFSMIFLL